MRHFRTRALAVACAGCAAVALAAAPQALAAPPAQPGCTFAKGVTTCTTTTTVEVGDRSFFDGGCQYLYLVLEVTTRTTKRHGRGGKVISDTASKELETRLWNVFCF